MKTIRLRFSQAVRVGCNGLLRKQIFSDFFIVEKEFVFYLDYETKSFPIIIPKGFKTDFGSIPALFRIFFNPTRYVSYILHDYMYSKKGARYSRKQADLSLLEGLNYEGASIIEKFCIYYAVRLFGWLYFKK